MSDTVAVSASELLGGSAPTKKQRPPWPKGHSLVETYPGSRMYRHPVDKAYIKPADAIALGAPQPISGHYSPDISSTIATPLSAPPAQPAIEPQPQAPPQPQPEPQPQPAPEPQPGPAPDFSNLPPGEGETPNAGPQGEREPTEEEMRTAYERMGAMFWDSIIRLLCVLFGDFWAPTTPDERKMVLDALTGWMRSAAIQAFTPLQNLWMAIGLYSLPRLQPTISKIVQWWKSRKGKKNGAERDPPEAGQEKAAPVDVESETVWKGPVV